MRIRVAMFFIVFFKRFPIESQQIRVAMFFIVFFVRLYTNLNISSPICFSETCVCTLSQKKNKTERLKRVLIRFYRNLKVFQLFITLKIYFLIFLKSLQFVRHVRLLLIYENCQPFLSNSSTSICLWHLLFIVQDNSYNFDVFSLQQVYSDFNE